MKNGFLVTFEGGEGCGKSTQVKKFVEFLQANKTDFLLLREPGGTEVGEKIRQILLHDKTELSPRTEFLLFSASRNKLLEDVVVPALESGKVVVLDRFYDSSFVYQGYAGNLDIKDIENITAFACGGKVLQPDLTFLLDIDFKAGIERKSKDNALKNLDRIESKGQEYHQKVRQGYLQLAKQNKNRVVVIDAMQGVEEIAKSIQQHFKNKFKA